MRRDHQINNAKKTGDQELTAILILLVCLRCPTWAVAPSVPPSKSPDTSIHCTCNCLQPKGNCTESSQPNQVVGVGEGVTQADATLFPWEFFPLIPESESDKNPLCLLILESFRLS